MTTPASATARRPVAEVDSREELIYLLSRAAELEHALACLYLYAAHSLKADPAEGGLDADQAAQTREWKRRLSGVAVEEMLHLAQVANLLTAIGGAPNFRRSNFPVPANAFSFGMRLTLEPFSSETIDRFVCYEMPEAGVLPAERAADLEELRRRIAPPLAQHELSAVGSCEPHDVDYTTIGEFYHKIESGFSCIPQATLFIGPPEAQARGRFLDFGGQLLAITDASSAKAAIEMIVAQGEAPTSDHPNAHFCVFDEIRRQYAAARAAAARSGVAYDPVRPVASNPTTRFFAGQTKGTLITDRAAAAACDLYNLSYDTLLLMLLRYFAHGDESDAELQTLAGTALRLMAGVLRPLGEALAKMPAGPSAPGKTAGPGFGNDRDVHLLPHKRSAWIFFGERLHALTANARALAQPATAPSELVEAASSLESLAARFVLP
jgi:hypothetical protein